MCASSEMDDHTRALIDTSVTKKVIKRLRQVAEQKPDPEIEIYSRLRKFDRRQQERWGNRTVD